MLPPWHLATPLTRPRPSTRYVFPGVGLAASVAGVSEITDSMLYRAAVACVDSMTKEEIESGCTPICHLCPTPPPAGQQRRAGSSADLPTSGRHAGAGTFPELNRIREVSRRVAVAVIDEALKHGLATKLTRREVPTHEALDALVHRKMYNPVYVPLVDKRRQA